MAPPTDKAFLLKDADRIRLCALNYYILPAREKGQASVSIHVGTLAEELTLEQGWANVFQALKGQKFQEMANVPPPRQDGADASPATTLTFDLTASGAQDTMTEIVQRTPTNLILYGPPGTGKTYETAFEAVRLCHGDDFAADLRGSDKRAELMHAYQALVHDGRVDFITFHQSFSYEDFVEGLRPTTALDAETADAETDQPTAGFSLKPHEGAFKRISERARLDTGTSEGPARLDRSRAIFKVALGARGTQEDRILSGLNHGIIHVGWGGDIDWSDGRFDTFDEIFNEWRSKKEPDAGGHNSNIVVTFSFRAYMQVGDYVVISDGRDKFRAFGQVTGEYYFDKDADYHPHRRKIEWLWRDDEGADRSAFYANGFRRHSVYKLNSELIDWDALEEIVLGDQASRPPASARDFVLIIDEINRANISKVFGELITLLEPDKRLGAVNELRVRLPYSGRSFGVPANLHIIGTMNTADRSIALLDTALRRRFTFRELMPKPSELPPDVDGIDLPKLMTTLNARIEYLFDREHQIGHAYFMGCQSRADVEAVIRDNVIPLLAEYFYDDWAKIAAVMDGRRLDADDAPHDGGFLRAEALRAPGFEGLDADMGARLRWSVKEAFDFAEFEG